MIAHYQSKNNYLYLNNLQVNNLNTFTNFSISFIFIHQH